MRERRERKVRIDLNRTDLTLIRPGLDLAVKRQQAALNGQGLQPRRGYDKGFAKMLRDLQGALPSNKAGEFYFDATQISALTFALSETRRKRLQNKTARSRKQNYPLIQKFEMAAVKLQNTRKCAEREDIKRAGKQHMTSAGKDGRHLRGGCMMRSEPPIKRTSSDLGPSR